LSVCAVFRAPLQLDDNDVHTTAHALNLSRGGFVVFAPGASLARPNAGQQPALLIWPHNYLVVLLGSAKAALCDEIALSANARTPGRCPSGYETTLPQALALIAGSRQVVSNDSGLIMWQLLAMPQVALFGSSIRFTRRRSMTRRWCHMSKTMPPTNHRWIALPCFLNRDRRPHRYLNDISAERVLANGHHPQASGNSTIKTAPAAGPGLYTVPPWRCAIDQRQPQAHATVSLAGAGQAVERLKKCARVAPQERRGLRTHDDGQRLAARFRQFRFTSPVL
jgi:hypothetical protein